MYSAALSIDASQKGGESKAPSPNFEKVPYVRGVENPTEGSKNIVRWLVKHGYGDEDIRKVMGGNALRILSQVWP